MLLVPWGLAMLRPLIPPGIPRSEDIRVDLTVAFFSLGVSIVLGVVLAVLPALLAADTSLGVALRPGTGRTVTRGGQMLRSGLVMVQVAFAVILLAGAGLLFNTLRHLAAQELGFSPARLLTANLPLSGPRFAETGRAQAFTSDLLRDFRQQGVVLSAAGGFPLPFTGDRQGRTGMIFEGRGELDLGIVQ